MIFSTFVTTVATLAAGGFVLVAAFQVFLALGVPWGHAAWGGLYDVLPVKLRIGSSVSAVVLVMAALVVLGRSGYWEANGVPVEVFRWGTWALVGAMILSALGNFASSSGWERFLMGPVALLLAFLCLVVAVGS